MNKLDKEELSNLKELNAQFQHAKIELGDLALQQQVVLLRVQEIKKSFLTLETALILKYGEDAVINLDTGEIKTKE